MYTLKIIMNIYAPMSKNEGVAVGGGGGRRRGIYIGLFHNNENSLNLPCFHMMRHACADLLFSHINYLCSSSKREM